MNRAYYSAPIVDFLSQSADEIIGTITQSHTQDLLIQQTQAWLRQIHILQSCLVSFERGHIFFEFQIPRMGKRADVILIVNDCIFILEFKVGAKSIQAQDMRQVYGYALDLHHFHEGSHNKTIVPILIATEVKKQIISITDVRDQVYEPIACNAAQLNPLISHYLQEVEPIEPIELGTWLYAAYKPTPTIIEAAQALYANHEVSDISRNDAGAINLRETSSSLQELIHQAHTNKEKIICFVTGVPGAGKTLVGLNIATSTLSDREEHAVFLSGNGPLVEVLNEALARDSYARRVHQSKKDAERAASAAIQNIHKFRDEYLKDLSAPNERVVIFDEAQRAWDAKQAKDFMEKKRGQIDFNLSEPEFLIGVMDRHPDWCVIVALIGGGQEINKGEAGLQGWIDALANHYPNWKACYSDRLNQAEYAGREVCFDGVKNAKPLPSLHLATSMRSFRAEKLSHMVHHLIHNDPIAAATCYQSFREKFPITVTRDLHYAKAWIQEKVRANESKGVIASSNGLRLKPCGIHVKNKIQPANWFLNGPDDVRSCHYLEDAATEFDIQGLELDWCIVAWDADFRYVDGEFQHWRFKGSEWQRRRSDDEKRYLENAYRVLLTRARQGMAIYIPEGNEFDRTRADEFYKSTFNYIKKICFD